MYKIGNTGLQKVAEWYHNYIVTSLVARESRLFVGDAICSVSIIDVVEAEESEMRLESVAKDFSPLWPVTVESLDQDTIIGANVSQFPYLIQSATTKVLKNNFSGTYLSRLSATATFSLILLSGERPRRLWNATVSGT